MWRATGYSEKKVLCLASEGPELAEVLTLLGPVGFGEKGGADGDLIADLLPGLHLDSRRW